MAIPKKRLGDLLIDCNFITSDQLEQALGYQKEHGLKLGEALIQMNIVTEDDIIWAIANQLNISHIPLTPDMVSDEVLTLITPEFSWEYKLMPLYQVGKDMNVCMVDPLDSRPIEYLESKFGVNVAISICTSEMFETTYNAVYANTSTEQAMGDEINGAERNLERGIPKGMEAPEKVINYILGQAVLKRADCVHFETTDKGVLIRFRSNDTLSRKIEIPLKVHKEVVAKLKALSLQGENQVSKYGTQVGHFRITVSEQQVNVQTIFYPTVSGEMVVLKLKDYNRFVTEQLNNETRDTIKHLYDSIELNHGVLYVTGPRESGRASTLYCILSAFDAEEKKLVTIENPVVSSLPLITQIQVGNNGVKTQSEALNLALMLDADLVYIDQVKEKEIIEQLAYAAIGGKTVLTSFLAYDVASSIVKLLETGVDPVVLASSLCGFANQRLLRVLCAKCKAKAEIPVELHELLENEEEKSKTIYKAVGCDSCNNTGYAGKTLILEYLVTSEKLRQLIKSKGTYQDFYEFARNQGVKTLEQISLQKMLDGDVSADEYMRLF
jgi:type II secretory ATPase GspE/PulE/Tfp pilus assembly ATPase PilB-like protein